MTTTPAGEFGDIFTVEVVCQDACHATKRARVATFVLRVHWPDADRREWAEPGETVENLRSATLLDPRQEGPRYRGFVLRDVTPDPRRAAQYVPGESPHGETPGASGWVDKRRVLECDLCSRIPRAQGGRRHNLTRRAKGDSDTFSMALDMIRAEAVVRGETRAEVSMAGLAATLDMLDRE